MIKRYILPLFFLYSLISFSQENKTVNVQLIKRDALLDKIVSGAEISPQEIEHVTTLQSNKNYIEFDSNRFDHSAVALHKIIIQILDVNNRPILLKDANLKSIKIYDKNYNDIDYNSNFVLINLKETLGDNPNNGEPIKIEVETHSGIQEVRWFRYINGIQGYNFLNDKLGLWLPTNMYSTSFERSENGVRFTAMPIGLATGFKYNINQKFFMGLSVTLNYTLTASGDSQDSQDSYILQDFSVGPLLDFGGFFYIGYTKPVNLTNQDLGLKSQFVVGIGVEITKILVGIDN